MARNTPPMHAKGVYTLLTPWTTVGDALYECIAVRSFEDFLDRGESVYDRFYAPKGIDRATYEADLREGAHIVTLQSDTSAMIFVPDTYIDKYPDYSGVEYKRIVLSVLLGPIPDTLDLTHLKATIGQVASDVTGVVCTVNEHVAPYAGVVTPEQHELLEVGRQAAVTNRKIDRAVVVEQKDMIDAQALRIKALESTIINMREQMQ